MLKTIFGTDGIRCQMNTAYLTTENLKKLGQAIAQWAPANSHFIFGGDTRSSCSTIKQILTQELFAWEHTVSDAGTIPTPLLCQLVSQQNHYDYGIMITASHNPAQDNGIKIITPTQKLSSQDELSISRLFLEQPTNKDSYKKNKNSLNLQSQEILDGYCEKIKKQLSHQKFDAFKIVIDCAHGATSFFAPQVFKQFGFNVTTINNSPNGKNINYQAGALHPEQLIDHVLKADADFGCAFDGDGDRFVVVTRDGLILNGDDLLTIYAEHPRYQDETVFAGTIMSNQALTAYFDSTHKQLVRTPVGDKYLVQQLTEQHGLVGTEPSGHIILRDHSFCSDGIYAALLFFDTLLSHPDISLPLFTPYPSVNKNISVQEKRDLTTGKLQELIKRYEKSLSPGRLIIRYSGTEPLLRISIEHLDKKFAEQSLDQLVEELRLYL